MFHPSWSDWSWLVLTGHEARNSQCIFDTSRSWQKREDGKKVRNRRRRRRRRRKSWNQTRNCSSRNIIDIIGRKRFKTRGNPSAGEILTPVNRTGPAGKHQNIIDTGPEKAFSVHQASETGGRGVGEGEGGGIINPGLSDWRPHQRAGTRDWHLLKKNRHRFRRQLITFPPSHFHRRRSLFTAAIKRMERRRRIAIRQ